MSDGPLIPPTDPASETKSLFPEGTTFIGEYEGDWRSLPDNTIWDDPNTTQRWRKMGRGRLKYGGSHANAGAKPKHLRIRARQDLNEILHLAKHVAKRKGARPKEILSAINLLHKVGGMQSLALLNAEGDDAALPPILFRTDVTPVPVSQREERSETGADEDDATA